MTAITLRPETPADSAAVDALIDRAFGPGRYTKVSERVRERARFRPDLSMCAVEDGCVIGCARMWEASVGGRAVAFLGPLAVDAEARSAGAGAALVNAACEAARAADLTAVILVGDEAFFQRAGFAAAPAAGIQLPGPVDQRRVLMRWLAEGEAGALAGPLL